MEFNFYIIGSREHRPTSHKSIFVDGTADKTFRTQQDLELSHWIPNRSEQKYKAGTSTEMCFSYLQQEPLNYDLVINNHMDVDGVLSVFVLCYPTLSLQYRSEIISAANIGDFCGFSTGKALWLYQDITVLMQELTSQKVDLQRAYQICFAKVENILNNQIPQSDHFYTAEEALNLGKRLVESGAIRRTLLSERLVHYSVPSKLCGQNIESYLGLPEFCAPISDRLMFLPHVRNQWDQQRIQLISFATQVGYYHELHYPGYVWADTAGWWRPADLNFPARMGELFVLNNQQLQKAAKTLNAQETGNGEWWLCEGLLPFGLPKNRRPFPVVLSCLNKQNQPVASTARPEVIVEALSEVDF